MIAGKPDIMVLSGVLIFFLCGGSHCQAESQQCRPGAGQMETLLPLLEGKKLAFVINHASLVEGTRLLDTLFRSGISTGQVVAVFSPEHGFRGDHAAGAQVEDTRDSLAGIPVYSLYGKRRKPAPGQLRGAELVVFDLQDVGVRFYTYISTLSFVMESCAENGIPLLVLDRPNPNGDYVDGPVLEPEYASFVGMFPIPVVYGLTIGELAQMINGEGWLRGGISCELRVIPCSGYRHGDPCSLTMAPSPNLRNCHAIRLYPSLGFFEGTVVSEGRGTSMPFEIFGYPGFPGDFCFTPESIAGGALHPKYQGVTCQGMDLREFDPSSSAAAGSKAENGGGWNRICLGWLLEAYREYPGKDTFFTPYFEKLAGTASLRKQIMAGWTEQQIRASWAADLEKYLIKRQKYLIYP